VAESVEAVLDSRAGAEVERMITSSILNVDIARAIWVARIERASRLVLLRGISSCLHKLAMNLHIHDARWDRKADCPASSFALAMNGRTLRAFSVAIALAFLGK
jgi:hypothetical protein